MFTAAKIIIKNLNIYSAIKYNEKYCENDDAFPTTDTLTLLDWSLLLKPYIFVEYN